MASDGRSHGAAPQMRGPSTHPVVVDVDIWQVPLIARRSWIERNVAVLSDGERRRAARRIIPRDGDRFAISHIALRLLLSRYCDVPPAALSLVTDEFGKPRLSGDQACRDDAGPLQFSLSHAADAALVAVTRKSAVGVDVERVRPWADVSGGGLAPFFCPRELAALRNLPPDALADALTRCWVRKEAVAKALGTGMIRRSLASFEIDVSARDHDGALMWAGPPESTPTLRDLPMSSGYLAAVAAIGSLRRVVNRRATVRELTARCAAREPRARGR